MSKIDLQQIMTRADLNKKEVAQQLFPKNIHPVLALNRVMAGEALLDADQISKLSLLVGVPISDLFKGSEWKAQTKEGNYYLSNGDFLAILDHPSGMTKLFHKDSLLHEEILHSGLIVLSEYLEKLNTLILNYKQNGSN